MWQRFTERSRRVVFFAQDEAGRLGVSEVNGEHLLLGMVRENDTVAARVLDRLGVSLERVRAETERHVIRGDGKPEGDFTLAAGAKRVIDLAYDEARHLNNNYIGTEHLLLGLIREGESLAWRVLNKLGVELTRVREEVKRLQVESPEARPVPEPEPSAAAESERLLRRIGHLVRQFDLKAVRRSPDDAAVLLDSIRRAIEGAAQEGDSGGPQDAGVPAAPGDLGLLGAGDGRDRVEFALTRDDFTSLMESYAAKDHHGYRELVAESEHAAARVLLLKAGTEVKLLAPPRGADTIPGEHALFVRALNGTFAGKTGWVRRDSFDRIGPDENPFPPTADT